MIVGLIPVRGGSKRLPRKNLRILAGRPLVAWTILEAQKSAYLDSLYVTTEDNEIAEVAREYDCQVIKRPVQLAHDKALVYGAIAHAIKLLGLRDDDAICLLQATSPLRVCEDIDRCVQEYIRLQKPTMTVALGDSVANGAVYVGSVAWLKSGGSWDDGSPHWVTMDRAKSVDINELHEFQEAERIMKEQAA